MSRSALTLLRRLWPALAILACTAESADEPAEEPPPFETTVVPGVVASPETLADSLPPRIFFDLSRYEWYVQQRPVVWDEREWQPAGSPVALPARDLRLVGEFEGVDLYAPVPGDSIPEDRLYVPVSEGFWLPFSPAAEGRAP